MITLSEIFNIIITIGLFSITVYFFIKNLTPENSPEKFIFHSDNKPVVCVIAGIVSGFMLSKEFCSPIISLLIPFSVYYIYLNIFKNNRFKSVHFLSDTLYFEKINFLKRNQIISLDYNEIFSVDIRIISSENTKELKRRIIPKNRLIIDITSNNTSKNIHIETQDPLFGLHYVYKTAERFIKDKEKLRNFKLYFDEEEISEKYAYKEKLYNLFPSIKKPPLHHEMREKSVLLRDSLLGELLIYCVTAVVSLCIINISTPFLHVVLYEAGKISGNIINAFR